MAFDVAHGTSKRRLRPQPQPTINVTPLVDVILVVLIIFMLVTPMMMKTFWLNVPKAIEADKQEPSAADDSEANTPLIMTVSREGVIRINDHVIAKAELKARMPRLLAAKENKVLYFDASDDAPYRVAVEAMDLSRAAGARSIAIMTQNVAK